MAEPKVAPIVEPVVEPVAEIVKSPAQLAQEAEVKAEIEAKAEGFVKMVKDDVASFVHASTVAAHEAAGWFVKAYKYV